MSQQPAGQPRSRLGRRCWLAPLGRMQCGAGDQDPPRQGFSLARGQEWWPEQAVHCPGPEANMGLKCGCPCNPRHGFPCTQAPGTIVAGLCFQVALGKVAQTLRGGSWALRHCSEAWPQPHCPGLWGYEGFQVHYGNNLCDRCLIRPGSGDTGGRQTLTDPRAAGSSCLQREPVSWALRWGVTQWGADKGSSVFGEPRSAVWTGGETRGTEPLGVLCTLTWPGPVPGAQGEQARADLPDVPPPPGRPS